MKIIAKTFQGLEDVLAKEITALGAENIEVGNRMVSFTGDQEMLYRANFCLRTAVRVLKPIKEFKATDADEVYDIVKQMPWSDYMDEKQTFLIDSVVFSESFRHSKFVAYRVKDAIADYFREKTETRPNVSISNPDIRINVHIAETDVTISLDSSGESLHKRGYRTGSVAAPLNEVLAAGMIMTTGWDGECDLIDPFCGSGTILIEAALIAQNIYPGVFREEFGFERWKDFDEALLEKIYNDDSQEREFNHKIYGFDINRQCVAIATDNARSAGVSKIVDVQQQDFYEFEWNPKPDLSDTDLTPSEFGQMIEEEPQVRPAIMITNPPYGERITTDDILDLYATIGNRLKHAFAGNDAWILSSHEECFAKIGFRPSTKFALYNGSIPCEFRKYQVFSGRLSERRNEGLDIKTEEERQRNKDYKPLRRREESEFDGKSWRSESGSRDDEHYFRSRPDRNNRPDRKGRDARPGRREFKPLFEGDEEPTLNRYNFKWGDRDKYYESEEKSRFDDDAPKRRRDDDRRPFKKERRFDDGDERRDRKPFSRDKRSGDRDRSDRKFDRDRKSDRSDRKPFNRDKKHGDRSDRPRRDRGDRPRWGFDEEGRPFRRED